MIFLIVGSNGLVGSAISKNLSLLGYTVFKVIRNNIALKKDEIYIEDLAIIDYDHDKEYALINCGYNFSDLSPFIKNENYEFSKKLILNAKKGGVKYILNISSLSAYDECMSKYGRIKYEIEKLYSYNGYPSVRFGLIKTRNKKTILNLFHKIRSAIPFQLLITKANGYQYISDLEKFCVEVESIIMDNNKTISYCNKTGYTINDLLCPRFSLFELKVSIDFLIILLRMIECFFRLRFGSDSLIGLKYSNELISEL